MRFLLTWEMGHNYNHVTQLAELAKAIAKNRNQIDEFIFVLKTPSALLPFLHGLEFKLLQAPYVPPRGKNNAPVLTYMDDLRLCGYEDPQTLSGLVRAWRDLYTLIQPDIVICQSAPTALLVARSAGIKTMAFGMGYDVPPKCIPMPLLGGGSDLDPALIEAREQEALCVVNQALKANTIKPLKNIAQMLKADLECLTSFEEFDHYPNRSALEKRTIEYFGNFFVIDNGGEIFWNLKSHRRIFAYIRNGYPGFAQTMDAFSKLPLNIDVIVCAPGLADSLKSKMEKANIRIFTSPIKLSPLLKDCDLGVSHASLSMVAAFAVHGVPQFLLPAHIEQLLSAKAVVRNNLGTGLFGNFGVQDVLGHIENLMSNKIFIETAGTFAVKYKNFKPDNLADTLASRLAEI